MNIQVESKDGCRQIQVRKGKNLMKVLLAEGFTVAHPCDGKGKCKKCQVKISPLNGDDNPKQDTRSQRPREVLACLMKINEPLLVEIGKRRKKRDKPIVSKQKEPVATLFENKQPEETLQRILNQLKFQRVSPPFKRRTLQVAPMKTKDNDSTKATQHGSQWERLMETCSPKARAILGHYVEPVLPHLPQLLTSKGGQVVMTSLDQQLVALYIGEMPQKSLGFAAVCISEEGPYAGALLDLNNGRVLGVAKTASDEANTGFQTWMNQSLKALCDNARRQTSEVTDLVLTGDGWFMERLTGLRKDDASFHTMPFIRMPRAFPADRIGLEVGPHAAVLMMPAASLNCGSAKLANRIVASNESLPEAERALAGTVGCLVDRGCRKRMGEWALSKK